MGYRIVYDGNQSCDCVAVHRGDTGALCGLGKVLETPGALTLVCLAPEGVALNFKAWSAASGMDDPRIVACKVGGTADTEVGPPAGEIVEETLTLTASTETPTYTMIVGAACSIDVGLKGYAVKGLPTGLKYDAKKGIVSGTVKAAGRDEGVASTSVVTFSKADESDVVTTFVVRAENEPTIECEGVTNGTLIVGVAGGGRGATALPLASQVSGLTSSETVNVGSLQVTVSDVGKITAKVVAAAGTYSFTATGWDSAHEGVYSVEMTTKKGDVLTLACDSTAAWNDHQLTGSFVASGTTALSVEAQKNAFGKQWFFKATGDEAQGWTLSFAEDAKAASLTVTLNADGKTSVAGKLCAYKITASGYADVSGIGTGAIFADFAPRSSGSGPSPRRAATPSRPTTRTWVPLALTTRGSNACGGRANAAIGKRLGDANWPCAHWPP